MDGVLCDFDKRCDEYNAWKPENHKPDWNKLQDIGPSFWSDMEKIPGGMKLLEKVQQFANEHPSIKVGIFSAVHLKEGKEGKRIWLKKNTTIKDNIILINNGNFKHKYAQPNSILIDDKLANVNNYIESGNQAVLFNRNLSTDELFTQVLEAIKLLIAE